MTPLPVYKLSSEAKFRQEVGFLMSRWTDTEQAGDITSCEEKKMAATSQG